MKKKLKGFTLVELIMVLALFSIIMYSVLQLMDPVSKFFVRSSNYESNTSCIDNIKRVVEGNLKYANRIQAVYGYKPYNDRDKADISADVKTRVGAFYEKYFQNRKATDSAGYIYVLALDNTSLSDAKLKDYKDITSFNEAGKNSGKIILYKFWYDNYGGFDTKERVVDTAMTQEEAADPDEKSIKEASPPEFASDVTINTVTQDWYVNQKMYGNYEYRFDLGMVEQELDEDGKPVTVMMADGTEKPVMKTTTPGSDDTFNPTDFALTISMRELHTDKNADGGLVRENAFGRATSTFSMKNVLDASRGYQYVAVDYVLQCDDENVIDMQYTLKDDKAEPRYSPMIRNLDEKEYDGMYFIYTLADTCYTNGKFWKNQEGMIHDT